MPDRRLVSRKDVRKGCAAMPSVRDQDDLFVLSTQAYRRGDSVRAIRLSAAARDPKAARKALRKART